MTSTQARFSAGSKHNKHTRSDKHGTTIKGSAASAILQGAGRSLNAVREDIAERARMAKPQQKFQRSLGDGKRKPCQQDSCDTPHLKGSRYCWEHDR